MQQPDNDILHVLRHYQISFSDVEKTLLRQLDVLPSGASAISDFSHHIDLSIEKSWLLASVRYGDNKIRSGWLLLAWLTTPELRRVLDGVCKPLSGISGDELLELLPSLILTSPEAQELPCDGSGLSSSIPGESSQALPGEVQGGKSALAKYCQDMTAQAREGKIDPVTGDAANLLKPALARGVLRIRADGGTETFRYDGEGKIAVHTGAMGQTTRYRHGAFDLLREVEDAGGQQIICGYDGAARLTQLTRSGNQQWRLHYDEAGQLAGEDDWSGRRTVYRRDEQGRLAEKIRPDGSVWRYTRDEYGRVTEISGEHQQIRYGYDRYDRMVSAEVRECSDATERDYTLTSNITLEWDDHHRLVAEEQDGQRTEYRYDEAGRLTGTKTAEGETQREYDASGILTGYHWNGNGELDNIRDRLRGSLVFSYDKSGWLTGRTGQMYDHDHYYYDRAGNLLENEHQGPVMSNRLAGYGSDRYGYNEWGELETRLGQRYEWNVQGQLTTVISSNTQTHYQYDALGRRVRKVTRDRHTSLAERSRTEFIWEGYRLLQEIPQQGERRTYLYDAEQLYTPVASVTGRKAHQEVWYYHTDPRGRCRR